MPSPKQVAAARALLGWSQTELCEFSGLSYKAVNSYESENGNPTERTRQAIEKAFAPHVNFLGDTGVQLKSPDVKIYKGRDEFIEFMRSVYDDMKDKGGEVLVSNVAEKKFEEWLGDEEDQAHMARMRSITNLTYKVLLKEQDHYLPCSDYCHYRWTPKGRHDDVPLYLFNDKVAMIVFREEPIVYVISVPDIYRVFQRQFYALWEQSQETMI